MPILSDKDLGSLRIADFIFHVVQHGAPDPVLLDEAPITGFETFFLDRVRETLRGNQFVFVDGSGTCSLLRKIQSSPARFVEISKSLARDFHSRQDKRIKPGVLILIRLICAGKPLFSIIKFDHEKVVAYDVVKTKAILKELRNTFTESAEALQKSALISLSKSGGELVVVDRTVRADITDFFRGFLNVKRKFAADELTRAVHKVAIETVKEHQATLPPDITRRARDRFSDMVEKRTVFDHGQFIAEYFGPHGSDEVHATFRQKLENAGLEGELFSFDPAAVSRPQGKKYRTIEGVRLEWSGEAEDTVTIQEGKPDGFTTVTIRTRKLIQQ